MQNAKCKIVFDFLNRVLIRAHKAFIYCANVYYVGMFVLLVILFNES